MSIAGDDTRIEHLLRELAPQVLGAVARRSDDFAAAEDADRARGRERREGRQDENESECESKGSHAANATA